MFNSAVELCEVWRGSLQESLHVGHAVVVDSSGSIVSHGAIQNRFFFRDHHLK